MVRKRFYDKLEKLYFIKQYLIKNNKYRDDKMLMEARNNVNEFNDIVFTWRGKRGTNKSTNKIKRN